MIAPAHRFTYDCQKIIILRKGKTMQVFIVIVLGLLFLAVVYAISIYNNLVQIKYNVSTAWSNIDILLKQRHDELPKLVETCKQYKEFEQATLERVTAARGQVHQARESGDIRALGAAETALRTGLGQLFAVVEAYPDLKTNQQFMQLLHRISTLEDTIADRRELYNDSVNINNVRVDQFPDSIIAGMYKFHRAQLLSFDAEEKRDVDLKSLFGS